MSAVRDWVVGATDGRSSSRARFDQWTQLVSEPFGTQRAFPRADPSAFYGSMKHARVGAFAVSKIAAGPHSVVHEPTVDPDERVVHVNFLVDGSGARVVHGGGAFAIPSGGFVITNPLQHYEICVEESMRLVVLHMPAAKLTGALIDLDAAITTAVSSEAPETASLRSLLRAIALGPAFARQSRGLEGGALGLAPQLLAGAAADTAVAALARTLGEPTHAGADRARAVHVARMRAFVEAHLTDPALTPARIANAAHLSLRQAHAVFTSEGTTLARHIHDRRLELAASLLLAETTRARPVAEIAAHVGFEDASHFGRVFKRRFGTSPAAYRAR